MSSATPTSGGVPKHAHLLYITHMTVTVSTARVVAKCVSVEELVV